MKARRATRPHGIGYSGQQDDFRRFNMTAQIPESIAMDIYNGGITLCGGTAYMPGLADYFERKLEVPVTVPDMPETAAAMGALGFYRDKERLAAFLNVENL